MHVDVLNVHWSRNINYESEKPPTVILCSYSTIFGVLQDIIPVKFSKNLYFPSFCSRLGKIPERKLFPTLRDVSLYNIAFVANYKLMKSHSLIMKELETKQSERKMTYGWKSFLTSLVCLQYHNHAHVYTCCITKTSICLCAWIFSQRVKRRI